MYLRCDLKTARRLQVQTQSAYRVATAPFWRTFHHDGKISKDPIAIKEFYPKEGAGEGAENVPSSCSVFN